jgi:hypothetical protein
MKNNTVAQEKITISIPSISIPKRSIWSLLGFIAVCGFGYLQFVHFLIPGFVEISSYNPNNPIPLSEFMKLIWVPIGAYSIIGVGTSLLINIFKKIKSIQEKGFIRTYISSVFSAIMLGILWGCASGICFVIFALMRIYSFYDFLRVFTLGFFTGFSVVFVLTLIFHFFSGLNKELDND